MSSGVLLFAFNNEQVDYVSQAQYLAKRIRKYLDLPTTLVTDDVERVVKFYNGKEVFDEKSLYDCIHFGCVKDLKRKLR